MLYIVDRLKEPSSWASIAAIAALAGFHLDAGLVSYIVTAGVAVAGLVGFLMGEKS